MEVRLFYTCSTLWPLQPLLPKLESSVSDRQCAHSVVHVFGGNHFLQGVESISGR